MSPVQIKIYRVYDVILASLSGLIFSLYVTANYWHLFSGITANFSAISLLLALAHLIYMAGFYRSLARRSQLGASLLGTCLFALNIAIIVVGSGGLASPYYGLWLLMTLSIGIYRTSITLAFLALTTLAWASSTWAADVSTSLPPAPWVTLVVTYLTSGVGFWLWHSHHTKLQPAETVDPNIPPKPHFRAEMLLRYIGEGIMVINGHGQIQLLNPAAESLTGWKAEDAIGLDSRAVIELTTEVTEGATVTEEIINQALTAGKSFEREDLELTTKSGRKLDVWLMAAPVFNTAGRPDGAIILVRDISAAKAIERQRNEFISTASHEMRTPVAAIEGYISLALNEKIAHIDPTGRGYLERAQDSIHHLGRLFQDLLTTTRLEEGKLPNRLEAVDLDSLATQVIDELQFKARRLGVSLKLVTSSGNAGLRTVQPLFYVYADSERLREVITNLIDNALKFTPKGQVSVQVTGSAQTVRFGVADTGIGIAPEDVPHLFQKFYRVNNSKTQAIGGTGLGLYIARAIIEMYQGKIEVTSTLGKGTKVSFSLPRLSNAKAQTLLAAKHAPEPVAKSLPADPPALPTPGLVARIVNSK